MSKCWSDTNIQTVKKWYIFSRNTRIVLLAGLDVLASHWPSIISEDERARKRERCAIAPVAHRVEYPGTKSEQLRNDDAGVEIRGKTEWENGHGETGRGGNKRARSQLHCVTKRATRPTKSMSTLMRVPRCVKIPRRRNNIGPTRAVPRSIPTLRRWRIVVGALFFYLPPLFSFICDRLFIGAAMEYIFLRDACRSRLKTGVRSIFGRARA